VCVWGRDGRGKLTGSCRSDGSVHVADMLASAGQALELYGGHACAGGFTVSHERVHTLPIVLNEAVDGLSEKSEAEMSAQYDVELSIERVSWRTWDAISQLAPFGVGNPKPIFRFPRAHIENARIFGKENNHTEIIVRGEGGNNVRAIKFFVTPDMFSKPPQPGMRADLIATLERDTFRGSRAVALRIIDIVDTA